jgi:hypothetical protein
VLRRANRRHRDTFVLAKRVTLNSSVVGSDASFFKTRNSSVGAEWRLSARPHRGPFQISSARNVSGVLRQPAPRCESGGQNWIRTSEGVSQRIYSPPRLATSVSALSLVGSRVIRRPHVTARGLSKELPPAPAGLGSGACRRLGRSREFAPIHDFH